MLFIYPCLNRLISQIPQCTSQISYDAPFCNKNVLECTHFCYKMVYCVILNWCIVGLWYESSGMSIQILANSNAVETCAKFGGYMVFILESPHVCYVISMTLGKRDVISLIQTLQLQPFWPTSQSCWCSVIWCHQDLGDYNTDMELLGSYYLYCLNE